MISPDGVADLARRLDAAAEAPHNAVSASRVVAQRALLHEAANTLTDMATALKRLAAFDGGGVTLPRTLDAIVKEWRKA